MSTHLLQARRPCLLSPASTRGIPYSPRRGELHPPGALSGWRPLALLEQGGWTQWPRGPFQPQPFCDSVVLLQWNRSTACWGQCPAVHHCWRRGSCSEQSRCASFCANGCISRHIRLLPLSPPLWDVFLVLRFILSFSSLSFNSRSWAIRDPIQPKPLHESHSWSNSWLYFLQPLNSESVQLCYSIWTRCPAQS